MFIAKHINEGLYVLGFSPTHAQPIVTTDIAKAKHFSGKDAYYYYLERNPAPAGNWQDFALIEIPLVEAE